MQDQPSYSRWEGRQSDYSGPFVEPGRGWTPAIPIARSSAGSHILLPLLCAALATALKIALEPYVAGIPYATFFPAVVVTAMFGGPAAGLFCVVLCAAAGMAFGFPAASLVLFAVLSSGLVWVIAARHQTERKLLANYDRLQFVLDAARIGWWEHDVQARTIECDHRAMDLFNLPERTNSVETFTDRVHPDDREWILARYRDTIADPAYWQFGSAEYRIQLSADKLRWVKTHWLIKTEDGKPVRTVGTARDITQRKQREAERLLQREKEHLLMREVNHRAKNLLSIVGAIAHQTAARNCEDFIESFSDRIQALAANQNLLDENAWQGAEAGELVRAQLSYFSDLIDTRIVIEGPSLGLNAGSVQAIGLAVHELGTNAAKYGALSTDAGRVEVRWKVDGDAFDMTWAENAGPPVSAPEGTGFGTIVMQKMVERTVSGEVSLDYASSGLTWHLKCPVANVLEQSGLFTGKILKARQARCG